MGSGGSGGTTQTIQKADPWPKQQPYLEDIFQQAQNLYRTQTPTFYPGTTVAPFNPLETAGQTQAVTAALGPQSQLAQGASTSNQFLMSPDILRADSNPYLAQAAEAAVRPVFQGLTEQALPAVRSGAVAAGQYGGSRQGIAEGQAIERAVREAGDITSQMYSDAYGQNLEAMARGLALAPQTQSTVLAPAQTLSGVGTQSRAYEQALIDEAIQRHMFEQSIPWDTLAGYQGLVQGTFGGTGTSTVNQGGGSAATNILGAGMTGLGTYGLLAANPATMAFAPWAAGAMALASLF